MANHVAVIYDVFLSFRGDTRYAFTDNLYRALLDKGINAFRDDEKLRIGDEIRPSLLKAIEKSRISMVVLCENYASSTWCLDELAKIVACYDNKGTPVSVIFYKVDPSDVRHQKYSYEAAMIEHEGRFGQDSEKVKTWRSALSRVCSLSGVHCRDDMYESEIIKKIVKDTCAKLPHMPLPNKHVVGLDSHFEKVKSFMNIESDDIVCMLGIYGPGGIGKTEFARDLYDRIRHHFEAASFLQNVREKSNKNSINGLENLQMILLSEMGEETEIKIGSTFKGHCEIKRRIGHKRVLLVLDDVDSIKQLESLAGGHDWFGSGSRIIVTTRDISVLDKHVMDGVIIQKYKMEQLNDHKSLELFCWHAFNESVPRNGFANVSSRAISYARGFPLALKVIGSNLKGGSVEEWEMELDKYRKVPNVEIQDVLEISYNSLLELDKKIFLDIACFFKRERWEYVKRILKASDLFPVIRVFVSKCLITVDENGCLEMHDLIQDMGREIVRKESPLNPGDRSRLWLHKEVIRVLKENLGSSKVEGIMLDPPKHEKIDHWTTTAFEKMKNLRILIVRNTIFSKGPSDLPSSLRLLDWKGYPSESFPSLFCPDKIVDFKLPHSFLILEKPFQTFEDLTFINLSQCQSITLIPDMSRVKNLRVLTVDRCHKLASFDKSVGLMPNLVYLSALECIELKSFVPRMNLPSLEMLLFNFCRRLEHLADVIDEMDKPLKIHMINTAIKEFPESISNLTGLVYMDLSFCKGLKDLSSSFLLLPKLVTLKVDGCSQLQESFKKFKVIHSLRSGFPNLVTLYFGEANLSDEDLNVILEIFPKLEDLKVSNNNFVSLSKCIKRSWHLKYLDVSYCKKLIEIPELPSSIQKVNARHCRSLTAKASSGLWFKVLKEIERIQVVVPSMGLNPTWFNCVCNEGIPLFWARQKFPIVALAFMFGKVNDNNAIKMGIPKFSPTQDKSHIVGLHLFIDGQEICRKDYHYCSVGEHHLLLCDLRVLFNDEEWQGLDAICLGENWKAIQVQCESHLILSRWGVHVYKQKTNMKDIRFSFPNSTNHMPSSCLVPKTTPQRSEQKTRHETERCSLREIFGEALPEAESLENGNIINTALRYWWDLKANNRGEVSVLASEYGASLKREHEDSVWDVVRYLEAFKENVPKHIAASWPAEYMQFVSQSMELSWRARVEHFKDKGKEGVDIDMDFVLEACHFNEARGRRFWGTLEMKEGDPAFEAVMRRYGQFVWEMLNSNEDGQRRILVVLLKCQCLSTEEASSSGHGESSFEDPELKAFMMRIEEDVMRLNKTCGKLKASIVATDFLASGKYANEIDFIRTLANVGLAGFFFRKTPYGKLRAELIGWRFAQENFVLFWKVMFCFLLLAILCLVSVFDPSFLDRLLFVGMILLLSYVTTRKPGRTVG